MLYKTLWLIYERSQNRLFAPPTFIGWGSLFGIKRATGLALLGINHPLILCRKDFHS